MTAILSGARLASARLFRPSSLFGLLVASLAVAAVSLLQRRAVPLLAADRALAGVTFGIALPLLAYGSVARALGGARVDSAVAELARHGASRRSSTLGVQLALSLVLALAGAMLAALAVLVTRAPADPRLASDLAISSWIGALGGAAYAGCFLFGSTFGTSGGGRFWLLALDWVLGAGTTAVALPWPRGHLMNLLGEPPVLGLPQWSATLALLALCTGFGLLTLWRAPP